MAFAPEPIVVFEVVAGLAVLIALVGLAWHRDLPASAAAGILLFLSGVHALLVEGFAFDGSILWLLSFGLMSATGLGLALEAANRRVSDVCGATALPGFAALSAILAAVVTAVLR